MSTTPTLWHKYGETPNGQSHKPFRSDILRDNHFLYHCLLHNGGQSHKPFNSDILRDKIIFCTVNSRNVSSVLFQICLATLIFNIEAWCQELFWDPSFYFQVNSCACVSWYCPRNQGRKIQRVSSILLQSYLTWPGSGAVV